MTERNGRPVEAHDLMKVVFSQYMRYPDRGHVFIPDKYKDTPGFAKLLEHFKTTTIICANEYHDDIRGGMVLCVRDEGHSGGCNLEPEHAPGVPLPESLGRSLQQEGNL